VGAKTFENVAVSSLEFADSTPASRPVTATYKLKTAEGPIEGKIEFDYLVDASGRAGLMSVKYLKSRQMKESLKNIAVLAVLMLEFLRFSTDPWLQRWGYYEGAIRYGLGTVRENGVSSVSLLHSTRNIDTLS